VTEGARTPYDKVRAVERWLAGHATYRLDSPVPSSGEDAVDQFLFVDRTGFCEQFAAAEVVLLRAAGVPARLTTGLAYGQGVGEGRRVFRENMLHAWVEVPLGTTWMASDPTAGAAQAQLAPSLRERLVAAVTGLVRTVEALPFGRALLAVALAAVAVLALRTRRRPGRRRRARDSDRAWTVDAPSGRPALAAYLRWDATLGAARRRPGESLRQLAARLGAPPRQRAALAVVEQECYAPVPPSAEQVQDVERMLAPRGRE